MSTIDPEVLAEVQKLSDSLAAYTSAKATNDQAAAALAQAADRLTNDFNATKALFDAKVAAALTPAVAAPNAATVATAPTA